MQIAANTVVSIAYTLKDPEGNVLDSSEGRDPLAYLHGAGNIVAGLEKALEGKSKGDKVQVTVAPEEGYGQRDDKAQQNVPLRKLVGKKEAAAVRAGQRLQVQTNAGVRVVTVVSVRGDYATIDVNHPLAGMTLNFDVEVKDVREATPEEREHRHVHTPGSHAHG